MKIRKAVGAIIRYEDKYLLVRKVRSQSADQTIKPRWDFPKGGFDPNDKSLEDALIRELKEEVGVSDIEVIKRYDETITFNFAKGSAYDRQVTHMFLCEYGGPLDALVTDGKEIDQVALVDKSQVLDMIKYSETLEFLNRNEW